MKFEKKVILGSIGGFITTALGIIAVFFPSVFNLEKKTMEEINIFIKSQADVDNLRKAIEKNRGKLVKLDVTYCYDMNKNLDEKEVNYVEDTGEYVAYGKADNLYPSLGEKWWDKIGGVYCILTDKECKVNAWLSDDNKETKRLVDGVFLIGGALNGDIYGAFPNESIGALGFYKEYIADYVAVPYEAKGKYNWNLNDNIDGCVVKKDEGDDMNEITKETLSGVFYINEEDDMQSVPYEDVLSSTTILEPFNKKDLKMRDY